MQRLDGELEGDEVWSPGLETPGALGWASCGWVSPSSVGTHVDLGQRPASHGEQRVG